MFERLTEHARKALSRARQAAMSGGADGITPEHLLLGLLGVAEGVACQELDLLGVDLDALGAELGKMPAPAPQSPPAPDLPFSPSSCRVIEAAERASRELGHATIGSEHFLIGILDEGQSPAARVLEDRGVTRGKLMDVVIGILGPEEDALLEGENLGETARWETSEHLVLRSGIAKTLLKALQEGRDVALVGPKGAGKTSLVLSLAGRRSGGFDYRRIGFRSLRPTATLKTQRKKVTVWLVDVPPGESLGRLRACKVGKHRMIAECSEEPAGLPPSFVTVPVEWPDVAESRQLIEETLSRLRGDKRVTVDAGILRETVSLCREMKMGPGFPWNAIRVLWAATRLVRERAASREVGDLEKEIARFQRKKAQAIADQEFELASKVLDEEIAAKKRRGALVAADPTVRPLGLAALRCAIAQLEP